MAVEAQVPEEHGERQSVASTIFGYLYLIFQKVMASADFMIALTLVGVVVMLVIPLPAFLLDLLMSVNMAIGLVLILSSVYLEDAVDFSVFPSLLLVTTMLRLALNVSSTRLILLQGKDFDGEVIKAFGSFVVGGDYVVGMIIFIILILVQFMVITKGADRVAEVSARFTLDAMPGKQMAIDADLGAGLIDDKQANERRSRLTKEADFYGAMDGASKFVKGDTIAGMIITVVNIVGGIIIGYFSGKFASIAEIAQTYTLLTVGDGLVSIIPSLLISVAAGIIVTRAASEGNLGDDIFRQVFARTKPIFIASAVFVGFGFIPGLPKIPFFLIAILLFVIAYMLNGDFSLFEPAAAEGEAVPAGMPAAAEGQEGGPEPAAAEADSGPEDVSALLHVDVLELEIGYGLIPMVDPKQGGDLLGRVKMIRRQIAMELGLLVPAVRIRDNMQLPPNYYSVRLKGTEIGGGELNPDMFLAMDPGTVSQPITGIETMEPAFNMPALWIDDSQREDAEIKGYTVVDSSSVVATHLTELIKRYAAEILGRQEVHELLDKTREHFPVVVEACVPEGNPGRVGLVQKVAQKLLLEGVSIRNFSTILETIADHADHSRDIISLTETVRQSLARQLTNDFLDDNRVIRAMTLEPYLENQMAESLQKTNSIHRALAPSDLQAFYQVLNHKVENMILQGFPPMLLCAPIIRPHLKDLTARSTPQLSVLSFSEIVVDVQIEHVGTVGLALEE